MKNLVKAYSDVIVFLAGMSVFFWLFGTLLGVLPFKREIAYNWHPYREIIKTYYFLHFETQPVDSTLINVPGLMRNVGIFCEAPGYALFLDFGFVIELLGPKGWKNKRLIILLLAMLTSFSTKAYLIAIMGLFFKFVLFSNRRDRAFIVFKYVLTIIMIAPVVIAFWIVLQDKLSVGSGVGRLDDLRAGLLTFSKNIRNILFGVGFNNGWEILENAEIKRSYVGLSMGSSFLASGGLYLLFFYLVCPIALWVSKVISKKNLFILVVLLGSEFFISFVGTYQVFVFAAIIGYTYAFFARSNNITIQEEDDRSQEGVLSL